MLRFNILLEVFRLVLKARYDGVFAGICFIFEYRLSLNFIDCIIPCVIQSNFACLYLLNCTFFGDMLL